jgi:hypothetical protein
MKRNDPLTCRIEDGVLIISIGVDCLAHAIQMSPGLSEFDEESGEWATPEVTDADKFAIEVVCELEAEAEDGTTLVHIAFDRAAANAIENGAQGVKLPGDE